MLKPLIWKEWHEQRWKLAFGTVMLAFFTGALMAAKSTSNREIVVVVWILGGLILSLYSAMGVFAPEITDGTKTFLASKPIQPWKIFLCKWFFGWLNFAVPMLICSAALALIALLRPESRLFELKYIAKGTFTGVCMGTAFYNMTCCFAPRKSGEAFVGFIGLIVFVIMMVHILITQFLFSTLYQHGTIGKFEEMILFINPLFWVSFMKSTPDTPHISILFIEQALLLVVVMLVGLRKWQRSS